MSLLLSLGQLSSEICDRIDNNYNGETDEGLSTDADGDGHYTPDSCKTPNDDCDDNDPTVYPCAKEICDGKDNNCDGVGDYPPGVPHGPACDAYKECGLKGEILYRLCMIFGDGSFRNCVRLCLLERWLPSPHCRYEPGGVEVHLYCWFKHCKCYILRPIGSEHTKGIELDSLHEYGIITFKPE